MMVSILHNQCGKVAFWYDHPPFPGETFDVEHAYSVSGNEIMWHQRRMCGSCGKIFDLKDLHPGPPILRTFDMSNSADMAEFYKHVGAEHFEGES